METRTFDYLIKKNDFFSKNSSKEIAPIEYFWK